MPKAKPKVEMLQILDENGNCKEELMPALKNEDIRKIYRLMVLSRIFDETALKLQREGRMLTFASIKGQEGQIAGAYALQKDDWVVPSFRENGVLIARGMPMHMLYQYWGGDERGMKIPDGLNIMPVAIPVSTQIPHAVGIAIASKLKNEKVVTAVYFGDGATSKGDFHEGMNFAGVFKAPVVFINQNNQWAISVPFSKQTAAETVAQKATAYGFEGIRVDGNDAFAVYKAVKDAADKARKGGGPTLIECLTYRMGDHTTADDATKYRTEKEVEEWKKKDPIDRLRKYMIANNMWTDEEEKKLLTAAEAEVSEAVKQKESNPDPTSNEIFDYIYADLPEKLKEQREMMK